MNRRDAEAQREEKGRRRNGQNPVEEIAGLYEKYPTGRTFREDLEAHLLNGYVFSTPECFLMGRAVDRFADAALIDDPWHAFPREAQNCWLAYAGACCKSRIKSNNICQNLLRFMPYPLKWVAWQRRGRGLRFYKTHAVRAKCG